MVTWRLDRLAQPATWCLLAAVALSAGCGIAVDLVSDVSGVRGGLLVGSLLFAIGGIAGSLSVVGVGLMMIGTIATLADLSAATLAGVGAAQFLALGLADLSMSLRRSSVITTQVWRDAARTLVMVAVVGVAMFTVAWAIANLTTWQAIVVPFVVLAIGYALRFAADAHAARTGP